MKQRSCDVHLKQTIYWAVLPRSVQEQNKIRLRTTCLDCCEISGTVKYQKDTDHGNLTKKVVESFVSTIALDWAQGRSSFHSSPGRTFERISSVTYSEDKFYLCYTTVPDMVVVNLRNDFIISLSVFYHRVPKVAYSLLMRIASLLSQLSTRMFRDMHWRQH